jgi:hypothetical protein
MATFFNFILAFEYLGSPLQHARELVSLRVLVVEE